MTLTSSWVYDCRISIFSLDLTHQLRLGLVCALWEQCSVGSPNTNREDFEDGGSPQMVTPYIQLGWFCSSPKHLGGGGRRMGCQASPQLCNELETQLESHEILLRQPSQPIKYSRTLHGPVAQAICDCTGHLPMKPSRFIPGSVDDRGTHQSPGL